MGQRGTPDEGIPPEVENNVREGVRLGLDLVDLVEQDLRRKKMWSVGALGTILGPAIAAMIQESYGRIDKTTRRRMPDGAAMWLTSLLQLVGEGLQESGIRLDFAVSRRAK